MIHSVDFGMQAQRVGLPGYIDSRRAAATFRLATTMTKAYAPRCDRNLKAESPADLEPSP